MKISLSTDSVTAAKGDLIALGAQAKKLGKDDDHFQRLDKAMGGALTQAVKDEDFKGERGEVLKVPAKGRVSCGWVVLVGIGDRAPTVRDALLVANRAAQAVKKQRALVVALPLPGADSVRSAVEGVVTGAYRFDKYLTGPRKPKGGLRSVTILVADKNDADLKEAASQGQILGEAVNLARDLVNGPPNEVTATALADVAKKESTAAGAKCTVWNKKQIEKAGMNLFLAVNRGSYEEPRFVHMSYKPANPVAKVVFVGKGITFDAGGLCLKPPKGMIDMKCDMSGAATTIGVLVAAARMKLSVEVHGIVGATDNLLGGNAYKPGDVFGSLDGKSVEIINTDAEGRLVLADCLAYARELEPDYLIDHATLTGACLVALGKWTAGLFSNDEDLSRLYLEASNDSAESFWNMPLTEDLRDCLKSDVADLKHVGEAHGGAITAALFLREFVGKTKWAHCDIAGPAFLDSPHGVLPKGGTGFGVSTGISFLRRLATGGLPEPSNA